MDSYDFALPLVKTSSAASGQEYHTLHLFFVLYSFPTSCWHVEDWRSQEFKI